MTDTVQETVKTIEGAAIDARRLEAELIIKRNVLWAMGAGAVPVPILDMALTTGVQLRLLKQLSDLYGVAFSERLARKLLSSLLVGVGGVAVGLAIGASLAKFIPGIGLTVLGAPILVGALTQAVGNVFVMHFETGGTFLDFNAISLREYFRREYEAAKDALAKKQRPAGVPIVPPVVPPVTTKTT
jgi:uncharacterized protein (DUF697 family)